jgi:hypothetical protein
MLGAVAEGAKVRGGQRERRVHWRSGLWGALLACLGCAPSAPPSIPAASPAQPVSAGDGGGPGGPGQRPPALEARRLRAHITLDAGEGTTLGAAVGIELDVHGPSGELGELRLASAAHGTLAALELSDDAGVVPFAMSPSGEALLVKPGRPVRGGLRARYRIESAVADFDDAVATTLGADRVRLSGETAFLLPSAFDGQPLVADLEFDLSSLPAKSRVASTLGPELSPLRCTGAALRHASFLGGRLNTARFVTDEATDEWVWLEVLGFDARPVSGETAALRSELARYFESRAPSPYVVLAEASVRPDSSFTAASRSGGLLLELPVGTSWAGAARISVARELFRPWFGGEVRLGGAEGGEPSPRELWFNEGVARALARELVFRFAMLTPEEYADEINGFIGSVVLSPLAGLPAAEVAQRAATDVVARRHLAARGVLYATSLGRRRGGGRPLDALLRELFALARAERRALTLEDWLALASKHAGASAEGDYRRQVEAGQLPAFAPNGLGPCFRLGTRRYVDFSLGFDLEQSRNRSEGVLGLDPRGPATRAGLRATDIVLWARYQEGDPAAPASLDIERSGKKLTLQYAPIGRRVDGPAWLRQNAMPDFACSGD